MKNLNIDINIFAEYVVNFIEEINLNNNITYDEKFVSPLKLQKLLYFTYVYALINWNKKLWNDNFEKWRFGPVIKHLYHQYSEFGFNSIKLSYFNFNNLTNIEKLEIDCLLMKLNKYNAIELSNFSHTLPWKKVNYSQIITDKEIINYYSDISKSENDVLNFNNFKKTNKKINWESIPEC